MLAAPVLLLVMLLPAFLELKKPRDAGPRRIMPGFSQTFQSSPNKVSLLDLEEPCELDSTLKQSVNSALGNLPSLEV